MAQRQALAIRRHRASRALRCSRCALYRLGIKNNSAVYASVLKRAARGNDRRRNIRLWRRRASWIMHRADVLPAATTDNLAGAKQHGVPATNSIKSGADARKNGVAGESMDGVENKMASAEQLASAASAAKAASGMAAAWQRVAHGSESIKSSKRHAENSVAYGGMTRENMKNISKAA